MVLVLVGAGLASAAVLKFVPEPPVVAPFGRLVNLGFSSADRPTSPIEPGRPLLPGRTYYLWVEIGPPVDRPGVAPPDGLAATSARIVAALFSSAGQFTIRFGEDIGEVELRSDGSAPVVTQPARAETLEAEAASQPGRLFFPVRTPDRPGSAQLRCNLYHRQALVQSHLVEVAIQASYGIVVWYVRSFFPRLWHRLSRRPRRPRSVVDFTLAPSLDPAHLSRLAPQRLSIMLNANGDGTHSLRFFGEAAFKHDAEFTEGELEHLLDRAREALCWASWGHQNPWKEGLPYLYAQDSSRYSQADRARFTMDLARLATRGFEMYDQIAERLSGGRVQTLRLAQLLRRPAPLQVVHKRSAQYILPAGLIYDYLIDPEVPHAEFNLCPTFVNTVYSGRAIAESPCFQGDCPSNGQLTTVCPSGFWGFRHQLGMPLSVDTAPDAPTELTVMSVPQIVMGVSTDPRLVVRKKHTGNLEQIRQGIGWHHAETRADLFKQLREANPHMVYLYCHGGLRGDGSPFLQVGGSHERGIIRASLRAERIYWVQPRPLVFINGCHTAVAKPSVAFNFISGFIETSLASGVIGTEITVFEPLASIFAEECLKEFLNGTPIGESIRLARLAVLKQLNPLGLVYSPYTLAELRLVMAADPP